MARYVALSKNTHRSAGLLFSGYSFAAETAAVPVVAEELPQVVPTMVVAFSRRVNGDGYELVALQSLDRGTNLYVHTNGRWIGGYKPAWYREHPFRLLNGQSGDQKVVCIDEASESLSIDASDDAARLFDDQGEPSRRLRETLEFLQKLDRARAVTDAAVQALAEAGLIIPWPIKVGSPEGGEPRVVNGVFQIDEPALRKLEPDTAAELLRTGAMSIAFAQLLSEHRLSGLSRLYKLRDAAIEESQKAERSKEIDLEDLFGDDDQDLSFNF